MKVILTKDVTGIGRAGDVKEVSDGHARNFLLPRHLALPATTSALSKLQKEESERQAKLKKEIEQFAALKNKLESKTFTIKGKANKQSLFAAIHEKEIAKQVADSMNLEITAGQVVLDKAIKTLGEHEAEIRFAGGLKARVRLNVEALG
jgi:large subunit ribosomal protein L9